MATRRAPMSWEQLGAWVAKGTVVQRDFVHGPTNAHSKLRLFGERIAPEDVRVTLFRDNHAWCPYCQKTWLWLEEMRVPYSIQKVTMFCYGEKEDWYKRVVPSGMLPALQLDGTVITESDVILAELEGAFGTLGGKGMNHPEVVPIRRLERTLFRSWCNWLCYPSRSAAEERAGRAEFLQVVAAVEAAIAASPSPYFLEDFCTADVIFTPYIERMSASLYYYKGYTLRDPTSNPHISAWFDAMESRECYRGTQSDFHTHCHDLPPQMGGCYENGEPEQQRCKARVDSGPWDGTLPEVGYAEPDVAVEEAVARTVKHRDNLIRANIVGGATADEAVRCALTALVSGEPCAPPAGAGADKALRYIRDRVNVPRDMSLHAARHMRRVLEETAASVGGGQGPPIPTQHRRDQDPRMFSKQ